jgi:hypothetical protein
MNGENLNKQGKGSVNSAANPAPRQFLLQIPPIISGTLPAVNLNRSITAPCGRRAREADTTLAL